MAILVNDSLRISYHDLGPANGKAPPFQLAYADNGFPRLDQTALNMHAALKKAESPVELVKCADRNHYTIIIQFVNNTDPLNKAFREFVQKNK